MRVFSSFWIVIAILFFNSCTKDEVLPGDNQLNSIRVSFDSVLTRASSPGDKVQKNTEGLVHTVQIYITDQGGRIHASREFIKDNVDGSDWHSLTHPNGTGYEFNDISSLAGNVIVIGNPVWSLLTSDDNINSLNTELLIESQQDMNNLLYAGRHEGEMEVVGTGTNGEPVLAAKVMIRPLVARFQINSVNFETKGDRVIEKMISGKTESAKVEWDGFTGELKGIYMNRFYRKTSASDMLKLDYEGGSIAYNTSYKSAITEGKWLFGQDNLADFAAYCDWNGAAYETLLNAHLPDDKSYAFNFFPGDQFPVFHIDVDALSCSLLNSDNPKVFDPSLLTSLRFANVVRYRKEDGTTLTEADFVPGMLYNLEINIEPVFLTDDLAAAGDLSLIIRVEVSKWDYIDLTGDFDY